MSSAALMKFSHDFSATLPVRIAAGKLSVGDHHA
jgi:hypothetical protein